MNRLKASLPLKDTTTDFLGFSYYQMSFSKMKPTMN